MSGTCKTSAPGSMNADSGCCQWEQADSLQNCIVPAVVVVSRLPFGVCCWLAQVNIGCWHCTLTVLPAVIKQTWPAPCQELCMAPCPEVVPCPQLCLFLHQVYNATKEEWNRREQFESGIKRPYFHVKPIDNGQLTNWSRCEPSAGWHSVFPCCVCSL